MSAMSDRLRTLAIALGTGEEAQDSEAESVGSSRLPRLIAERAGAPRHAVSYLVIACITDEIPRPEGIKSFSRRWRLDGLENAIHELVARRRWRPGQMPVRVVAGPAVVDVTDTLASTFTTGIQRVARETLARWWADSHDLILTRWDSRGHRLVSLTADEVRRVIPGAEPSGVGAPSMVIPFETPFVLPEISVRGERTLRLRTIARYSGGRSIAIGFDCIPITTAETAAAGMPGEFSKYLSALARFDVVAPISDASATEFHGWRRMLAGTGIAGPDITTLELPFTSSGESDPERASRLREELGLGDDPIVLGVGSHEPRKNHLSLLHAAELAWRAGMHFTLVLVGGNSWETERFDRLVSYLRRRDRRIVMLSGVSDDVIWDLYDLARFSVFCSLNEGFGLPVVESLSHRTPVITSDFGSMRALGSGHGALLVPPLDIDRIEEAMASLLQGGELYDRLVEETASIPATSWESYADELWKLTESRSAIRSSDVPTVKRP